MMFYKPPLRFERFETGLWHIAPYTLGSPSMAMFSDPL